MGCLWYEGISAGGDWRWLGLPEFPATSSPGAVPGADTSPRADSSPSGGSPAEGFVLSGSPARPLRRVLLRGLPGGGRARRAPPGPFATPAGPEPESGAPAPGSAAVLVPFPAEDGARGWVLLGSSEVLVNGCALVTGIRVLRSRDELRVGRTRWYYSSERAPEIVAFPESEAPVRCRRCGQDIRPGSPAFRCTLPGCGAWCHQSSSNPCWTGPPERPESTCPGCSRPASLEEVFQWTPEGL